MSPRLVFVPLIGPQKLSDWANHDHIKVWGIWDEDKLEVLAEDSCDPAHIPTLGKRIELFASEKDNITDVDPDDTTLPDDLCIALAKRALLPVRED